MVPVIVKLEARVTPPGNVFLFSAHLIYFAAHLDNAHGPSLKSCQIKAIKKTNVFQTVWGSEQNLKNLWEIVVIIKLESPSLK